MFYKYKVGYYNSYEDKEKYDTGLTWAKDYGEAANAVVRDYGKDSVFDVYLYEIIMDDDTARCINEEEIQSAIAHE